MLQLMSLPIFFQALYSDSFSARVRSLHIFIPLYLYFSHYCQAA
jgi:hypothetical protein